MIAKPDATPAHPDHRSPPGVDVLLVSMPFAPPNMPSLALGLLKGSLAPLDLSVRVEYFSLQFVDLIGNAKYRLITDGSQTSSLLGEWVFNRTLFETEPDDVETYVREVLYEYRPLNGGELSESALEDILEVRGLVDDFLNRCVQQVVEQRPRIVGFTSTFEQHVASLALAKRIREAAPETVILFGGANCEGMMGVETLRQFPFIDAVVCGEGDVVFPQLVQRILAHESIHDLPGVHTSDNLGAITDSQSVPYAERIASMDDLPLPDFDDFLAQLDQTEVKNDPAFRPKLTFETSRGCWWGAIRHCTFCGLNGVSMTHRSKTPEHVLREFDEFVARYSSYFEGDAERARVQVVDNIIDNAYFDEVLPQLATRQPKLRLFYETKANLKKEQIRILRDARVVIQPGVESLSTEVLQLMRKGVKGIYNIQLLKWCQEYDVIPYWNFLWGFPGESPGEYERMAALMPSLHHLQPAMVGIPIILQRFSPNFDLAEQFGFVDVVPLDAYAHIYPFPKDVLANLAYHFDYGYQEPRDVASYTEPVTEQILTWNKAYPTSALFSVDHGTHLEVWDLRGMASEPSVALSEPDRTLYLECDGVRTLVHLRKVMQEVVGLEVTTTDVEEHLDRLVAAHLMVREGNAYLALAIPVGDYAPRTAALEAHGVQYDQTRGFYREGAQKELAPVSA